MNSTSPQFPGWGDWLDLTELERQFACPPAGGPPPQVRIDKRGVSFTLSPLQEHVFSEQIEIDDDEWEPSRPHGSGRDYRLRLSVANLAFGGQVLR